MLISPAESSALATALDFARGAVPYVDQLGIHQNGALLLAPFLWGYVKATGGTAGIALFARVVYLAYVAGISFCLFRLLRKDVGTRVAAVVASLPALFVPLTLFGWDYHAFAMHFLLLAFCFAWVAEGATRRLYWSGFLLALAFWCYPPYVFAALLLVGLVMHRYRRNVLQLVWGGLTASMPFLVLVAIVGPEAVGNVFGAERRWLVESRYLGLIPAFLAINGARGAALIKASLTKSYRPEQSP